MLASMTGLAYFMGSVVKLEGYLGYFLPLPIVVSALRWGPATGWRTVVATCCLIAGMAPAHIPPAPTCFLAE